MSLRRKAKLTVDKLERLEIKTARRIDMLKRRLVELIQMREQLKKTLDHQ